MTNPYLPIMQVQDVDFPPAQARRFENYLVTLLDVKAKDQQMFNFVFKDGANSQITTDRESKS